MATRTRPTDPAKVWAALSRHVVALAKDTPDRRRATLASILAQPPGVRAVVLDRPARAAAESRSPAVRAGAADALAELGPAAAPTALAWLAKAASGRPQAAFARVLERVGPAVPGRERADLWIGLEVARLRAADAGAAAAAVRGSLGRTP
jgi:hypothetical protein